MKTVFQSTVQLLVKVNLFDVVRCQTKFFGRRILASQLLFGYSSVFPCLRNGVLKSHKGIRKNPPVRSNKIKQRQCTHRNIASLDYFIQLQIILLVENVLVRELLLATLRY